MQRNTGSVRALLKLYRPINNIMAGIAVIAGAFIAAGPDMLGMWQDVLLAFFVVFFFTGGGNALNDYIDRGTDKENHPERPIPSGDMKPPTALHIAIISLAIPLFLGVFINLTSFLIILLAEVLMISYELRFKSKGLPGNAEIAVLVGLLFLFGAASVGKPERALIFSLMAMLANMGREIVKDIEDMEGDRDRKTLPKSIGKEMAGMVAAGFFMAAVSLSAIPYGRGFNTAYLLVVSIADVLFFYTAYLAITDARKSQKMAKLAMLVGLIAFLVGRA